MSYESGPFDQNHVYVQWGGTLPGGEVWSCGLRMVASAPGSIAQSDPTFMTGIANAIKGFHGRPGSMISPRAVLTFVKANAIGTNGKYLYATTQESVVANQPGGSTQSVYPPNQLALAISLTTGVSRGPAHRGRFYSPVPTVNALDDGLIDTTGRDMVKTSANQLLADLNAVTPNFQVGVFSRKLGNPAHRLVTGIEVGRALDTIRRRRNKLAEKY